MNTINIIIIICAYIAVVGILTFIQIKLNNMWIKLFYENTYRDLYNTTYMYFSNSQGPNI